MAEDSGVHKIDLGLRQKATLYRSLSVMLGAGLPIFAVFEFLAREGEGDAASRGCRRISQSLVSGRSLDRAAASEPGLFTPYAVKMIEVGVRSGSLVAVLGRLADDAEADWKVRHNVLSQLAYPLVVSGLALLAVLILPSLALADLLTQVVALTDRPPALTRGILWLSSLISSPWFLALGALLGLGAARLMAGSKFRGWLEQVAWQLPAASKLVQSVVSLRFLRTFAMMHEAGIPVAQGLVLAAQATGSRVASPAGPRMSNVLVDGATLREAVEAGEFLPRLALEALHAGEHAGRVSAMIRSVCEILQTELEYRVESVLSVIEPVMLGVLGIVVGTFALGCLLPILQLTESL